MSVPNLLTGVDSSATAYRRTHQDEDAVTVVKQMPRVERAFQPTIAVITSQYHEKLAVDAVMTNKQTFVRYATVGKTKRMHVYQMFVAFLLSLLLFLFDLCTHHFYTYVPICRPEFVHGFIVLCYHDYVFVFYCFAGVMFFI